MKIYVAAVEVLRKVGRQVKLSLSQKLMGFFFEFHPLTPL
jgi:hypothetical protein